MINKDRAIFDVDEEVAAAGGPSEYKKRMWAVLMKREADFITSSFRYDSTVVRVKGWNESAASLTVQPAQYSDQLVTNHERALEQELPNDPTRKIRDLAYASGELRHFGNSPMSNTIGIAGMIHTKDRIWVIGLRSRKNAFDPGKWGCSASGALEWAEPPNWNGRDLKNWMRRALARECGEELGFRPSLEEIHYLAFAREFGRAGKPQFFFVVHTPMRWRDVERSWKVYASDERELSDIKDLDEDQARTLVGKDSAKVRAIVDEVKLSEELRMNLALAIQNANQHA